MKLDTKTLKEWTELYNSEMAAAFKREVKGKNVDLNSLEWLQDDQVEAAIGSIWIALWNAGYQCAYPLAMNMSTCVAGDESKATVDEKANWRFAGRGQNSLMMVVTGGGANFERTENVPGVAFTDPDRAQKSNYHHVLVIAERFLDLESPGDQLVDLNLYDSWGEHPAAFNQVQKYIEESGWMGVDEFFNSVTTPVKFRERFRRPCAQQMSGGWCGLHVVLNAWVCAVRRVALTKNNTIPSDYMYRLTCFTFL